MPPIRNSMFSAIGRMAYRRDKAEIKVSTQLVESAKSAPEVAVGKLNSSPAGLSSEEAVRRLKECGPNTVVQESHLGWLKLLWHSIRNPLVILLTVLALVSHFSGDDRAAIVMMLMVVLGVALKFFQEFRADKAAEKLKAMISVTSTVIRDGKPVEVPVTTLVPGDIITLAAGDMIPGDVRLMSAKDLFVIQASLTGESLPVEKFDAIDSSGGASPIELRNICFMGTSVESGTASAVVVATGLQTYLGSMAGALTAPQAQTSFDRGVNQFTWLMLRFMFALVPLVFVINGLTKHNWHEAFFFSVAVAVGLTPEMLPMIVTVCLSKGAIAMSRKKVIVKRLNSIQNFGAMDVLCTDKTGTLTMDHVILERHCNVVREENDEVLGMAFINSHFQTGLKNMLDRAVLAHDEVFKVHRVAEHRKVDEIPFDFTRRIMSVVVETPEGRHRLIAKGAPEEIFKRCSRFEIEGELSPVNAVLLEDLREEYENLSSDGFRVLALAYRDLDKKAAYSKDDERDLVLKGYLAFLDPPKESTKPAIAALQQHGISVKVLTGDNELVSKKICGDVGLRNDTVLLGSQIEKMTDAELAEAVEINTIFARVSPAHKQRVIKSLQSRNHVVGFMGDGINDAPALRAADVGVSVDSAVDIAKEAADVILLEKSLMVLEEGVLEGRKVFANILKYVRMGASSNFGNMFSVLGASAMLKFLPMAPIQILTNNLLYDFSQVPIPADNVDPDQITKPTPWSMKALTRFIVCIGPISSVFDYMTYFIMLCVFKCGFFKIFSFTIGSDALKCPDQFLARAAEWAKSSGLADANEAYRAALFQTGWFVESLCTQTLIIHVIRTAKIPFIQSNASAPMRYTTVLIIIAGILLSQSHIGRSLGFVPLPALYWPLLAAMLLMYFGLTQLVKNWLQRRKVI